MVPRFVPAIAAVLCCSLPFATGAADEGCTIHVPGDHATIQEALDAAVDGCTILVAPGTYAGSLNRNLDFQGKEVLLRGTGGAAATVIDCQLAGRGFEFRNAETSAAVVEGFTVTNGFTLAFPPGENKGAGVLCVNGSSPTIRDCVLVRNEGYEGAGMHCDGGAAHIINTRFEENGLVYQAFRGGGLDCINTTAVAVTNCEFIANNACCAAMGGGIALTRSTAAITGCRFDRNRSEGGGGIACMDGSSATVADCFFSGNSADNMGGAGIGCYGGSNAMVSGCVFIDGFCFEGGAVMCAESTVAIRGSTLARNGRTPAPISAVHVSSRFGPAHATIARTVITFNFGAVACDFGATADVSCSDVFGNEGGDWVGCIAGQVGQDGNFAADPRFCDLEQRDLRLAEESPCLPGHHPQGANCELIGALGLGCGTTPVREATWGAIKESYR